MVTSDWIKIVSLSTTLSRNDVFAGKKTSFNKTNPEVSDKSYFKKLVSAVLTPNLFLEEHQSS